MMSNTEYTPKWFWWVINVTLALIVLFQGFLIMQYGKAEEKSRLFRLSLESPGEHKELPADQRQMYTGLGQ